MNKQQCHSLVAEVNGVNENIKAEILVAALEQAIEAGQDLQIEHAGSFARPYSADVLGASAFEVAEGSYSLRVQLSRNGIYDMLPEALCHTQQLTQGGMEGVQHMTEKYRKRKHEEALARKFFRPIENEFFFQAVSLEQEEQVLLYHPSSAFYQFLVQFWGIEGQLPAQYEAALLGLLPNIHAIAGDLDRIAGCLSELLEVPVFHQTEHRTLGLEVTNNKLGKGKLGQSFTVGGCVHAVPFVVFTIGPIALELLPAYLPGGTLDNFVKRFLSFTLPFEADAEIRILSGRFEQTKGDASFGVLGFSASI